MPAVVVVVVVDSSIFALGSFLVDKCRFKDGDPPIVEECVPALSVELDAQEECCEFSR